MTVVPLGAKDEEADEAVAAFTTPLVMISFIRFTAPAERVLAYHIITVCIKTCIHNPVMG